MSRFKKLPHTIPHILALRAAKTQLQYITKMKTAFKKSRLLTQTALA